MHFGIGKVNADGVDTFVIQHFVPSRERAPLAHLAILTSVSRTA
jgi:hypothetical protein